MGKCTSAIMSLSTLVCRKISWGKEKNVWTRKKCQSKQKAATDGKLANFYGGDALKLPLSYASVVVKKKKLLFAFPPHTGLSEA